MNTFNAFSAANKETITDLISAISKASHGLELESSASFIMNASVKSALISVLDGLNDFIKTADANECDDIAQWPNDVVGFCARLARHLSGSLHGKGLSNGYYDNAQILGVLVCEMERGAVK